MIAILVAIKTELESIKKDFIVEKTISKNGWRLFTGQYAHQDVLLVQTGVGKERAVGAAEFILENYPITTLISSGYGGALTHDLHVGDLVLCQKLQCVDSSKSFATCYSDPQLVDAAAQSMNAVEINLITGDSITVDNLVSDPDQKRPLAKTSRAKVVDMESYWIAKIAAQRALQFLAVRAISDVLTERLPPFDRFVSVNGKWLNKEAIYHFISRPKDFVKLPQIYLHTLHANRSLGVFFRSLIPVIGSRELTS